jgi:hypothetical protein
MDSTNDVIIGVVENYSWEAVGCYARSLYRSGFKGTKLMCVRNVNDMARKNLRLLGFTVVDYEWKPNAMSSMCERFLPAIEWLAPRVGSVRYAVWCDVRDLVFQSDPSLWLEKHLAPQKLLGCSEGVMLYDEPINADFVKRVVSSEDYAWLINEEQLCSGTIAGEAKEMLALMKAIHDTSYTLPDFGAIRDQALLNYLIRTSPFKEVYRIVRADDAFALQANWYMLHTRGPRTRPDPRLDMETGLAYPSGSTEPYCILHQYDRDASGWLGNFKAVVERHWSEVPDVLREPIPVPIPVVSEPLVISRPVITTPRRRRLR